MDDFEAKYEIDDGYIGGSRPQHFRIGEDEIDIGMSEDEMKTRFYELAEEHMREHCPVHGDPSEFLEWAKAVIAEREKED